MSLEVDARNSDLYTASQRPNEGYKYINGEFMPDATLPPKHEQQLPDKRIDGLRRTIICLGIALGLALVLCAVVAGVAGSIAAKRETNYNDCEANIAEWNRVYSQDNNFSSTVNTSNPDFNSSTFRSSSDCVNLTSPYTSPNFQNAFDIHCNTDFPTALDIMGLMVYTFEDCISACSSYNERNPDLHSNSTCYTASFDLGLTGVGPSCFLKGVKNIAAQLRPGVTSSAVLITQ